MEQAVGGVEREARPERPGNRLAAVRDQHDDGLELDADAVDDERRRLRLEARQQPARGKEVGGDPVAALLLAIRRRDELGVEPRAARDAEAHAGQRAIGRRGARRRDELHRRVVERGRDARRQRLERRRQGAWHADGRRVQVPGAAGEDAHVDARRRERVRRVAQRPVAAGDDDEPVAPVACRARRSGDRRRIAGLHDLQVVEPAAADRGARVIDQRRPGRGVADPGGERADDERGGGHGRSTWDGGVSAKASERGRCARVTRIRTMRHLTRRRARSPRGAERAAQWHPAIGAAPSRSDT